MRYDIDSLINSALDNKMKMKALEIKGTLIQYQLDLCYERQRRGHKHHNIIISFLKDMKINNVEIDACIEEMEYANVEK